MPHPSLSFSFSPSPTRYVCLLLLCSSFLPGVTALMFDIVEPGLTPPTECSYGCAPWASLASAGNLANQTKVNELWASQEALNAAGRSCAMPANFIGEVHDGEGQDSVKMLTTLQPSPPSPLTFDFSLGPQCYCAAATGKTTMASGYCGDPIFPTPQQVNLQISGASDLDLSVAFVTLEQGNPSSIPQVELCSTSTSISSSSSTSCRNLTGTTTFMQEPQDLTRIYSFHVVPLTLLSQGTSYSYRVRTSTSAWRGPFTLRTRDGGLGTVTSFAIAGDLGVYPFNCFGNLLQDAGMQVQGSSFAPIIHAKEASSVKPPPPQQQQQQPLIDLFIHLGDHAYNMAMANGSRGDAYMLAFQPILSHIPWIAVEGNHELESSFGTYCPVADDCVSRYLNQTAAQLKTAAASNSTTNRYFSIDIGLVHFINLDYVPYLGLEPSTIAEAQLEWLRADLLAATKSSRRALVPWIMILAHIPMYCSGADISSNISTISGDGVLHHSMHREYDPNHIPVHPLTGVPLSSTSSKPAAPPYTGCVGVGVEVTKEIMEDIEPLMFEFGVDLHLVGHEHFYESLWPVGPNATVKQRSFDSPQAPVHVVTGAGGAPAYSSFTTPAPFTRKQIQQWSYSRVVAWNSSVLTWQQVNNTDGTVLDSWTIVQPSHGPFPMDDGEQLTK